MEEDLTTPSQEPSNEWIWLRSVTADELRELDASGWGEGDHQDAGLPPGYWDRLEDADA